MHQLHHISLLTRDIPATTAFWRDQLGLRLVKNTVNQENWHMRHLFYGDNAGDVGSVVTFFNVSQLGPRYDHGSFMASVSLAIPEASQDFWRARLGSLRVTDPNDVQVELVPTNTPRTWAVVANDIPEAMQIRGLAASRLHVEDLNQTATFFSTLLDQPNHGQIIRLAHGGSLALVPSVPGKHRFGRGSIDHIAISVADRNELAVIKNRAQASGYEIEKYADRGWFQSLYLLEPNGNRIEFATPTPGFTLDEPLAQLGQGFGLPPYLEGERRQLERYWASQGVLFND